MVRAEESHELCGSVHWDFSGLVHIEVAPSLGEVSGKVLISGGTRDTLMGVQNFVGGSLHSGLVHGEDTGWVSSLNSSLLVFLSLSLNGVLGNH